MEKFIIGNKYAYRNDYAHRRVRGQIRIAVSQQWMHANETRYYADELFLYFRNQSERSLFDDLGPLSELEKAIYGL